MDSFCWKGTSLFWGNYSLLNRGGSLIGVQLYPYNVNICIIVKEDDIIGKLKFAFCCKFFIFTDN